MYFLRYITSLEALISLNVIKILQNALFNHSKDVRLPVQLQRAMAAEAEAAREARAKVIKFHIV